MNDYFKGIMDTVNKSIEDLDEDKFYKLVDDTVRILRDGGKVVITGLGKNAPICEKFVGTMLSFGLESTFLHTNTAVHGDLGTVRDDDLVIILSKSGETAESIYLLEHLKKRKSLIWSITFNENSRLAKGAPNTLALKMSHEGDEWDKVPNNSTTIYLIVLQALAMNVSKRMGVTYEDFIRNHPGGAIGDAARKQ
ncbi:MAG: SIS domain-containing protein [Candidatus Methanomethylophilaceae archaeon]|jgi:arabinose-5-phosphate isomerase|nr:SIS domain-containing protein [Candidatus Methanomethylophilaceae archaeon]